MKKLNRSKLLGMVTAGAIVVTTAFSFAAWGTISATQTKTVNVISKINTSAEAIVGLDTPKGNLLSDNAITYEGTVDFTVTDAPTTAMLNLVGTSSDPNYTVKLYEDNAGVKGTEVTTPVAVKKGAQKYHVELISGAGANGGEDVEVTVKGTLQ